MRHLIFISLFVLSSCNYLDKNVATQQQFNIPNISHFESSSAVSYRKANQKYISSYGEIALDDHPEVDKWIRYFTGSGRNTMRIYLERSSRYLPIMKTVIRDAGLPDNLVYVALIESGFSARAHSHSNAVGYWQFIYGTGKRYGLKVDGYVDERRDPVLSTHAAVSYFKDLYSLFGSWHLALAAYNAGEYRINRAVLRHYSRSYWQLIDKKALPRETRNYVPKLIATIRIAKNPGRYGFHNISFQDHLNYDLISISKPISIKKLAKNMRIPYKDLKKLNPMYKGEYIPVYNKKDTYIRLPVGTKHRAQASLAASIMVNPPTAYHHHYWYKVRRGDTLYGIARKNRTTVSSLRRSNRIGRRSIIHVGQKIKVPTRRLVASKKTNSKKKVSSKRFYTVKKGDIASRIAKSHGIKLSQLKKLNNLSVKTVIHPGQKLRIKPALASSRKLASTSKSSRYTVRPGDTLISIAKRYRVDLSQLMKVNSLNFKSILLAGTRLNIPH